MSARITSTKWPVPVALLLALLCSLSLLLPACSSAGGDSQTSQESASQAEVREGRLSVFLDAEGWDASQGSIPVTVSGTTDEDVKVDEVVHVVPGKPNTLPYEPGSYTFSYNPNVSSDGVVYEDCSITVEFDGTEDKTAQLALKQDTEEMQRHAEEQAEKERRRAEEEAKRCAEPEAAAQAEAQRRAEEEAQAQTNSQTVYITNTGAKYHENGCRYLKKSKIPISLSNAQAQGYEPCKVCSPPH